VADSLFFDTKLARLRARGTNAQKRKAAGNLALEALADQTPCSRRRFARILRRGDRIGLLAELAQQHVRTTHRRTWSRSHGIDSAAIDLTACIGCRSGTRLIGGQPALAAAA